MYHMSTCSIQLQQKIIHFACFLKIKFIHDFSKLFDHCITILNEKFSGLD